MKSRAKGISPVVFFLTFAAALSAAPRLTLSNATVGPINITTGTNGPNQTIQAYNVGTGTLSLTATTSASWLTASVGSQTSCNQASGGCYPVTIGLNTSTLAGGTYTEYVTLTDPNAVDSPQSIAVTVNTAPVPASITAYVTPAGGSQSAMIFNIYTTGMGVKGTVSTQSGGNWLQFLSGANGLIPSPSPWLIQVAAPNGLVAGTYQGSVVISGSSVPSDNKTINVTMVATNAPIISTAANATVPLTGNVGGGIQYANVNLTNLSSGSTLTVTSAASSSKSMTATVSGSSILIAADPAALTAGLYGGTVTLSSNAANNAQIAIPVEFTVAPAGQPMILQGGIVNAANGAAEPVSQGDIASIYGTQFAPSGTNAVNASTPLATILGGTQVMVNGVAAPLYYVGAGQINFQIPYGLIPGSLATVQVISNSTAGNLRSVTINAVSPRMLAFVSFISGGYGVIVNAADGSLTLPSGTNVPGFATHPAKPGDTITIYAIGFGQTTPSVVEGQAAPSTPPLASITTITSTFGGGFNGRATNGKVTFAGLTPTLVGLYQANVQIPSDTPLGPAVPVTLLVNNVETNVVYLAITASGK